MKNPCIDCKRYYPYCECEEFREYYNKIRGLNNDRS